MATSVKVLQVRELKDTITQLNESIKQQNELIESLQKLLDAAQLSKVEDEREKVVLKEQIFIVFITTVQYYDRRRT